MTGFVLVGSQYDRVPEFLRREVEGFPASPEYELYDEEMRELPGLACAALSAFLERLQEAELREGLSESEARSLDDAYQAIEALSRGEPEVQNLVQTEIFENFQALPKVWKAIEARLGPSATALLDDWKKRNADVAL